MSDHEKSSNGGRCNVTTLPEELCQLMLSITYFRAKTENVTWFEFDESGHQMHHQGGERVNEPVALGDFLKTPQYEVGNDDGKSTSSRGSKNKKVLQEKYERAFHPSPKVGSFTVPEGSWSHESRKVVPAIYNPNSFRDFTSLASQDDAGLVYVENQHMDRENDILYHDLPDTGSFEDIDRMLRICESTFGQGSSSADELSWFSSSSQSTYGIGDTFKSYSQSSILDPTALNGTLAHHSAITNVFPENNPFADDSDKILGHCYRSFVPVSSGENKSDCTPQEKAYDGDGSTEIKSTLIQVGDENSLNECENFNMINMHLKKLRRPYLFEGNEKDQLSESTSNMSFCGPGQMQQIADQDNVSSVFSAQPYSSQLFPKQNHVWGSSSSSNMHTFSLRAQLEGSLPLHQDLFAQKTLSILSASDYNPSSSYEVSAHASNYFPQCMENLPVPLSEPPAMMPEEINEKPCLEQILCGASSAKHPSHLSSSTSITSRQEQHHTFQHEIRGDSVQKDVSFKLPAIETDSSTIQESPCMTSGFSDDISLKAISFQQLQDVMLQLDSGTRLFIRDSLYRLAQSAERRHNFISANNSSKERGGGILDTEEPNRSAGYITTETETNSIDRSIAHLLFHRPSETVTRSSECATSLESHMIDEQIHGHVQLPGSNS